MASSSAATLLTLLALVLLCALTTSQGEEYAWVGATGVGPGLACDETGCTNGADFFSFEVRTYSRPTVVIAAGPGPQIAEFLNVALAGRNFVTRGTLVNRVWFFAETAATVNVHVDGAFATNISVLGGTQLNVGPTSGTVEISSTVNVPLAFSTVDTADYAQLPPVAQTIYGQCAASCTISIWGGDASIPIERSCTNGTTVQVQAGTYVGGGDYNGASCRWRAPDGYRISGVNFRHFTEHGNDDVSSFIPAEYFQLTTPVPTYFSLLMLISTGPARCLHGSNTVTLAGASGVYHARLTAVNAATVFECDTPVTAMGDGHCPSLEGWPTKEQYPACWKKEMNLIAAPVTTTTTTLLAAWVDLRRWKQGRSSDKHLLIPLMGEPQRVQRAAQQQDGIHDQAEERRSLCAGACAVGTVLGCGTYLLKCCLSSGALRDVADEIFSQWVRQFGEIRDLAESLTGGLELGVPTVGRMATLVYRLLSKTLVLSARRQVTACLLTMSVHRLLTGRRGLPRGLLRELLGPTENLD